MTNAITNWSALIFSELHLLLWLQNGLWFHSQSMILFLLTHLLDTYRRFSCDYSNILNSDVAVHTGMSESIMKYVEKSCN